MSAPPYMKLYVADYLGDTHHLGALEHGAYLLLLMGMWRAGGSLPAADANLAKLARCTPAEWEAIKADVLAFFKRSRGRLTHKRLTDEIAKYESTSGRRSEAGKRGAAEKANKNKALAQAIASDAESNCHHNQNHNQNHKIGVVETRESAVDDWPAGETATDHAARLATINHNIDASRRPGLITSLGEVARWRQLGWSWQLDVLPIVRAHGQRAGPDPVSTWKFFTEAIGRAHAARTRPPETYDPQARHERTGSRPPREAAYADRLSDIDRAMAAACE